MKRFKFPALFLAVSLAILGAFAFTPKLSKAPVVKASTVEYFELVNAGDPLERTDWVISVTDPDCPTVHSEMPCRIQANASGSNPSLTDFNDIMSNSNDFQQAYPAKVTYKP